MKFGFIGMGSIAQAIVTGVINSKSYDPQHICAYDINGGALREFAGKTGIIAYSDVDSVAENADAIILAVKPNVYAPLLEKHASIITHYGDLLLSLAAGHTLNDVERMCGNDIPIVRVMPNLNAVVGGGVSAVCANEHVTADELKDVKEFFSLTGAVYELSENMFPIFTAIAGCSPAFTYIYIDALATAAQKNGMPKAQALEIAAYAVKGSAHMLLQSGIHPKQLSDMVCSPGGTTIAGVCSLMDNSFESAVIKAVDAAIQKDAALRGKT